MTPDEFIAALDKWSANGGAVSVAEHEITTAEEAEAVFRALRSKHILAAGPFPGAPLKRVAGFFITKSQAAREHLRKAGLPLLRNILENALSGDTPANASGQDWAAEELRSALVFLVFVLALYSEKADCALLVKAVRKPLQPDDFNWQRIFRLLSEDHPCAIEVCEALADPPLVLPIGVHFLSFANQMAAGGKLSRHPFDSEAGVARLMEYMEIGGDNPAIAASAIPFLSPGFARALMDKARAHRDPVVRIKAAWAAAGMGDAEGQGQLVQFCLDPRYALVAMAHLEDLGLSGSVPAAAREPGALAMAEMSEWLAHPSELGQYPDEVSVYDTREIFWPPTKDRRRLWLIKFKGPDEAVGMFGSVTFALFGAATPQMPPEDIYGLHCCYELLWKNDPGTPKELSPEAGRSLLAEYNPGFGTA